MILPAKFSRAKLTFPLTLIYWSCHVTGSDWLGVSLIPCALVAAGIGLLLRSHTPISLGMWLALAWTSLTFGMLYYALYRVQHVFDQLEDVTPHTPEARDQQDAVRARIYGYYNNRRYYIVSALTAAIILPSMYAAFISHYPSPLTRAWGWIFFAYVAGIGGYGMACGVVFNRIVRDVIDNNPFQPNPHHPDLFMGLRPLGNLAVANAFVASSSSLLFPLIFEATQSNKLPMLVYAIFTVIVAAIVASFIGPLFIVKNKIEQEKFAALIALENEYQGRLNVYKQLPTPDEHGILQMLSVEREKLKDIRLFPFETKMLFQVVVSILLPIVMLLLQVWLKAGR